MPTIYDVVSPSGEPAVERRDFSPRLESLNGKKVGMLWNCVFRGDETFPIIGELLTRRFPEAEIVPHTEFPVTNVPSLHAERQQQTLQALTEVLLAHRVDAVIAGNAG